MLRRAWRRLFATPVFTIFAVISLALGVGVTTAIYSVIVFLTKTGLEAPDGDPSRQVGPHRLGKDDSEYFQAWNLGKKSVTLDLKSATGRAQFEALVKTADCVVNNMRGTQPGKR